MKMYLVHFHGLAGVRWGAGVGDNGGPSETPDRLRGLLRGPTLPGRAVHRAAPA